MTLDKLRPVADRLLDPFVDVADRVGLTPNAVSAIALVVAVAAAVTFATASTSTPAMYFLGGILVGINGVLDLVDGALAREQDVSSAAGDMLDHVFDRYADILIIAGLTAGVDQYALGFAAVSGVLMTSYLGTQAQAVGVDRVYGGLLGRADRLVLVGFAGFGMLLVAEPVYGLTIIGWLLALFAVVGHLTALQRFVGSLRVLSDSER
jgi:archaetidylinositol phosphate synthase